MTTRMIGMKAFRQNMGPLIREGRRKRIRYVVMNHSEVAFEVNPTITRDEVEDSLILEKYGKEIEEALEQAKRGEVYTLEEVMKEIRKKK